MQERLAHNESIAATLPRTDKLLEPENNNVRWLTGLGWQIYPNHYDNLHKGLVRLV